MNAIYVRVSTEDQAKHGYSLDDQLQSCRNHLLSMGSSEFNEYVDDGYSGEFLERPGLGKLRDELFTGKIKNVCIYDPDRLSRNLTNQLIIADEIEKSGAKLTFVTGDYDCSPEGRLFFSMKGAVSAYEKAKIRERTSRGRRAKASKGKIVLNAHPFGFDWDTENSIYIINVNEANIVKLIYDMCINHGWGARAITLELIRLGITGRNDKPLSVSTIFRILTKEMYCGTHYLFTQTVRKTGQRTREIKSNPRELWIPVNIPPIITREKWQMAQEQMKKNKKAANRNTKQEYLLRGILYCALCGRTMTAYTRFRKREAGDAKMYSYYSCISKESSSYAVAGNRCKCKRIPVKELEAAIWQTFIGIAYSEKILTDFLCSRDITDHSAEINLLIKKQADLHKKKADITRWYRVNLLDAKSAEKDLQLLNQELAATMSALSDLNAIQQEIKQPAASPAEILNAKTFQEKRDILLRFPYRINAVRLGENFEFWFRK